MSDTRGVVALAERRAAADVAPSVLTLHADDGAVAEVHRHGAHVTSWRPAGDSASRL